MRNNLQHILGGELARYWPGGVLVRVPRPKPAAVEEPAASRWERSWHVRSELSADRFASVHGTERPVPAGLLA